MDEPADFWENRYAAADRVWSGRANTVLVDLASDWEPGRALDLGCGEGADAIWLAQRGWQVLGVDIAPSAVARARAAAEQLGVADRAAFEAADLETRLDGGTDADADRYDLVTAFFLQSPVGLSRDEILQRASERVAPGGRLLIVAHATAPRGSRLAEQHEHHPHEHMPQPQDDLAALRLDPRAWQVELAEVRQRIGTRPDGERLTFDDGILLVRRAR